MKLFCIFFLLTLVFITAKLQGAMAIDPETNFNQLVDQYFDEYFKHNPTASTAAGFHRRDAELEDYSQTEVRAQVAMLKGFAAKFENIRAKSLRPETASDRELVISNINAALLDLEHVRSWEKNPDRYNSGYTIMSRSFAPADERLRSLISRERQMPKVFEAARANLKNPPRIFTEVALEQVPGTISFFKNDVPAAFTEVKNEKLLAEFKRANQDVIDALGQYEEFLKKGLLARSTGDFRLGAENFRKKLLYEEMVDIPLDRLLQIGYDNLHANQEWFKQTAAKLDPQRTPQQILDDLTKDHPAPDKLLDSVRNVLGGIRQFIIDHKIITIPSPVLPIIQDTPSFALVSNGPGVSIDAVV